MNIQEIKDRVNIVDVVGNYVDLTKAGKALKAKENPIREERTSSFFVYPDTQKYHDFGGEGGDVIQFIEVVENLDTHHACLFLVEKYLGGSNITSSYTPPIRKEPQPSVLTDQRHQQITADIEKFDSSTKQTFTDPGYKRSALSISPMWLYSQAPKHVLERFNDLTTYDEVVGSIVLKIRDYQGKLISYKHRYKNGIKWCSAKDTHPNKQCMVNIPRISTGHPIFIVEGAHDFLTMVLLELNVVAIQTVGYKKWTEYEISLLTGRHLIFVPDIDKEGKGVKCMRRLREQIEDGAKSTKMFKVKNILDFAGIPFNKEKMDISDAVDLWRKDRDKFISTLSYLTPIHKGQK